MFGNKQKNNNRQQTENLRSHPSIVEGQNGGVNNYVMHSNHVKFRPRLMGKADNRGTELLRTYPVKNVVLGECWATNSCGVV